MPSYCTCAYSGSISSNLVERIVSGFQEPPSPGSLANCLAAQRLAFPGTGCGAFQAFHGTAMGVVANSVMPIAESSFR